MGGHSLDKMSQESNHSDWIVYDQSLGRPEEDAAPIAPPPSQVQILLEPAAGQQPEEFRGKKDTKNPCTNFCFTMHGSFALTYEPTADFFRQLLEKDLLAYVIFECELTQAGRPHLQGYF